MRAQTLEAGQLAEACIAVQEPLDGGAPRNTARVVSPTAPYDKAIVWMFGADRLNLLAQSSKQKQTRTRNTNSHRSPDGQGQAAQGRVLVLLDLVADVGRLLGRGVVGVTLRGRHLGAAVNMYVFELIETKSMR